MYFLVVPHITNAIQDWVERVAKVPVDNGKTPDVCVIEVSAYRISAMVLCYVIM